jgi:hypothetical protein
MALLKSIDNVPGIDYYEYRDQDYYGKYVYRVRVKLPCVRYTWAVKTPDELDEKLNPKKKAYYGSVRKGDRQDFTDNLPALKAFVEYRNKMKSDKSGMIRIEAQTIAVFSNDLQLLKEIEQIDPSLSYDYTESQRSDYAGIKHFVNEPKHKYRIYLKSKRIPDTFAPDLKDLLERMTNLYASNALELWLQDAHQQASHWRYRYANPSHFIDYDDESTLSYLMLMHGDYFGKRYKLEKRPDTV